MRTAFIMWSLEALPDMLRVHAVWHVEQGGPPRKETARASLACSARAPCALCGACASAANSTSSPCDSFGSSDPCAPALRAPGLQCQQVCPPLVRWVSSQRPSPFFGRCLKKKPVSLGRHAWRRARGYCSSGCKTGTVMGITVWCLPPLWQLGWRPWL